MKNLRAIIIGILVWILGSSFYTASYLIPLMENPELQADLVLAIAIIPNAWLGAGLFYRNGTEMHGLRLGTIVLTIAILLDAMITVPYFIIPNGGSYPEFFGTPVFWLIALEYFLVVYFYWKSIVKIRALH